MKKKILALVGILALVAAMAAPMAALADATGTTTIGGQVSAFISFAAPGAINFVALNLGPNGPISSTGHVTTNNDHGCSVSVSSNDNQGRMKKNGAQVFLSEPLMVLTGDWILPRAVGNAVPCLNTGGPTDPAGTAFPLSATQLINPQDATGTYTLTLTYVATLNP
jgi:hypothetical protein